MLLALIKSLATPASDSISSEHFVWIYARAIDWVPGPCDTLTEYQPWDPFLRGRLQLKAYCTQYPCNLSARTMASLQIVQRGGVPICMGRFFFKPPCISDTYMGSWHMNGDGFERQPADHSHPTSPSSSFLYRSRLPVFTPCIWMNLQQNYTYPQYKGSCMFRAQPLKILAGMLNLWAWCYVMRRGTFRVAFCKVCQKFNEASD
jgi:hypothetical protein